MIAAIILINLWFCCVCPRIIGAFGSRCGMRLFGKYGKPEIECFFFTDTDVDLKLLVEDIKIRSWQWISASCKSFGYSVACWFINPKACLDMLVE